MIDDFVTASSVVAGTNEAKDYRDSVLTNPISGTSAVATASIPVSLDAGAAAVGAGTYMERDVLADLLAWKRSPLRKPLIVRGARQVGKTRVLKEFGRLCYENVAYFSLEKINEDVQSEYAQFFELTKNPSRIVQNLSIAGNVAIEPGKTLLILDEIQDCPAAVRALKYFCDEAPEYHVVCAGSLLGVALASEGSFPVGKVSFVDMYPMTFSEYLRAVGETSLDSYLASIDIAEPVPDMFDARLKEHLRAYFALGGMPEVVLTWALTRNIDLADKALTDLVSSYERDFAKHGGAQAYPKIARVWASMPAQLARENKKFVYGVVREGARAREYEDAITWLENAGLLTLVRRASKPGIPLSAYDDAGAFKAYCLDVGVLRECSGMTPSAFSLNEGLFAEFKGAFAESYVLQASLPHIKVAPRYWTNDKPKHEVDFLLQVDDAIVPVEVKSGENVKSPSLRYYARKYPEQTPLRVRFSLLNLTYDAGVLNIPLYLADHAMKLIRLALKDGGGQ